MDTIRLFEGEARFMDIVWDHEPVPSGKLVELAQEKLGWKKSTTYTVLRRLCGKGLLKNDHSVVTAVVTRGEIRASESHAVVEQTFAGSLPSFLVSFFDGKTITAEEADELKRMIDAHIERRDAHD